MPQLSIILPFHNESAGVHRLLERLYPALGKVSLTYEIICVDDGSSDSTFATLVHERQFDQRLKIVRFARNFGKETALTCGLQLAKGDAAVTMDSDLQHPPEVISDLVNKWREGFEVVHALRNDRHTDSVLRRFLARAFYAVFHKIADIDMPEGAGDFCLFDRKAIAALNALPERNRFMKGLASWVGFRQGTVSFEVEPRDSGHSNWSFFRLLRFAFDGISAFSTLPLRIWTWCGVLVSFGAIAYAAYLVADTLIYGVDVPGYASLMVGILFLGGLQLLSLGIVGEYLARIFMEVKARPLYLISEKVGF
ncbi:MAG: glycosyltransferase family 2 protein [Bdellovibrionales bacterium]